MSTVPWGVPGGQKGFIPRRSCPQRGRDAGVHVCPSTAVARAQLSTAQTRESVRQTGPPVLEHSGSAPVKRGSGPTPTLRSRSRWGCLLPGAQAPGPTPSVAGRIHFLALVEGRPSAPAGVPPRQELTAGLRSSSRPAGGSLSLEDRRPSSRTLTWLGQAPRVLSFRVTPSHGFMKTPLLCHIIT